MWRLHLPIDICDKHKSILSFCQQEWYDVWRKSMYTAKIQNVLRQDNDIVKSHYKKVNFDMI